MHDLTWQPKAHHLAQANVTAFMKKYEMASCEEFVQRATTGIEWFWDAAAHDIQMEWYEPYTQLLDASEGFLKTRWFLGGRTNITLNCLDRHSNNAKKAQRTALVFLRNRTDRSDPTDCSKMTYAELADQVQAVATTLVNHGVVRGDVVALHLPTSPFAVAALLAIFKIGAVAVPLLSQMSALEAGERAKHLGAKLVVDKSFSLEKKASEKIVLPTTELPSEYPAMILYSRGTTGEPKPIVHTHAGVLAQVAKEFWFNWDFHDKDVSAWLEPFGSLMSLWQIIGTLHFGGTAVLFSTPEVMKKPHAFLSACHDSGVTHLGLATPDWGVLKAASKSRPHTSLLKTIRVLAASGGVWDSETYRWCFEDLGRSQIPVMTFTGTTEFFGSSLAPLIVRPIKPLSSQTAGLGMSISAYAPSGYALETGQAGTLVCRKPTPSLAKGFWKDQSRFVQNYFTDFPNVWSQHDWVLCDHEGHWFMKGRVQDTVTVANQRILLSELQERWQQQPFVQKCCITLSPDDPAALRCQIILQPGIGKTRYLINTLKQTMMKAFDHQKPKCELVISRQ